MIKIDDWAIWAGISFQWTVDSNIVDWKRTGITTRFNFPTWTDGATSADWPTNPQFFQPSLMPTLNNGGSIKANVIKAIGYTDSFIHSRFQLCFVQLLHYTLFYLE